MVNVKIQSSGSLGTMGRRLKQAALGVAVAAAIGLPSMAFGQLAPEAKPGQPGPITPDTPKPANTLNIHGSAAVTVATDYITRGVLLENQGIIVQPTAELQFVVFENKDAPSFGKISVLGGIWNSIHSENEYAGSVGGQDPATLSSWFEFDWYAGLSIDLTPELNLNAIYQEFLSPSDSFGTCKNVQLKFSYNDSKLWSGGAPWEGFSLSPYGLAFYEIDGKAGTGTDEGLYVEVGIAPAYTFAPNSALPIKVSIPIFAGFGFSDFYGSAGGDDELFGFVAGGLSASIPLNFMSDAGYGAWSFSVSGYYYYFGDGVEDFNEATSGAGGTSEFVATAGVSMSF
jgi:hypothetical protein